MPPELTFTEALTELETIVQTLKSANVPLEDAMTQFERGVALVNTCQVTLKQANGKLEQLTETLETIPFEH